MNLNDIVMFDIEITSDCNAACPLCIREVCKNKLVKQHISLEQFKKAFTPEIINGKNMEFVGVLGDAITHPECLEIVEYVISNNCQLRIDTNGGYQTAEWWGKLGKISKKYNNNLKIRWAIDGHEETNHIYRRNTKFSVIMRNMEAYLKSAMPPHKHNIWSFILFEHNLHELEIARKTANQLNLRFQTRESYRKLSKSNIIKEKLFKLLIQLKIQILSLLKFQTRKSYRKSFKSKINKKQPITTVVQPVRFSPQVELKDIECRFYHFKWLFVGSDYKVWPCCHIWDEAWRNKKNILDKFNDFDNGWNDLNKHTLEEIIQHEYYQTILKESWNDSHSKHLDRCINTCLKNKRNIITDE